MLDELFRAATCRGQHKQDHMHLYQKQVSVVHEIIPEALLQQPESSDVNMLDSKMCQVNGTEKITREN